MSTKNKIIHKNCCGIPIRFGLMIFAAVKITVDVLGTALIGYLSLSAIRSSPTLTFNNTYPLLICVGAVIDMSFMLILIVGTCKKNLSLYHLSYYYSILMTLITISASIWHVYTYIINYGKPQKEVLIYAGILLLYFFTSGWMIYRMKCEINKRTHKNALNNRLELNEVIEKSNAKFPAPSIPVIGVKSYKKYPAPTYPPPPIPQIAATCENCREKDIKISKRNGKW